MAKFLPFVPVATSQLFLSKGSSGCPGGSLSACIDLCPTSTFASCVEVCQSSCVGPTPEPTPTPKPTPPQPQPSPTPHPSPTPVPSPTPDQGQCTVYSTGATNCDNDCGSCFNPGAPSGYMMPGQQTGYYAPSDVSTDPWTGACMDWTFGSQRMLAAEQSFSDREGDEVFLGVGTYG